MLSPRRRRSRILTEQRLRAGRDRALIDRAVAASGTYLTDFVVTNLTVASRRVLADRTAFTLGAEGQRAWEQINRRRDRSLAGLRALMERPSPFTEA